MDYAKESLKLHYDWQGKFEIALRAPLETSDDLSLAYTPGVAQPCLEIQKDVDLSYKLTRRGNLVAVVTDGTAVLGLGDIGPEAGMPVMEGKCALFKKFGNVDAIPLCIRSKDVDDIVNTVRLLAGSFGGINLEDISAPRCFEIEEKLKECCDIPIFHDDQHGTAVVTLAAMMNALKLTGKNLKDVKVVTSGAGAAGIAIIRLLIAMGLDPHHVILCDRSTFIVQTESVCFHIVEPYLISSAVFCFCKNKDCCGYSCIGFEYTGRHGYYSFQSLIFNNFFSDGFMCP